MIHNRIYLVGFMGAGKTTIGKVLAERLGWRFLDLDLEIEEREGRTVAEIFRNSGENYFRRIERDQLAACSMLPETIVALGGGAFIDAENRAIAEKTGLTVWLKVSFTNAAERVKIDGTRPMFTNNAQAERLYQVREPFYAMAKVHVSTDQRSPGAIVEEIAGVLQAI